MKRICVYCGSNPGALVQYSEAATSLARELAARDIGLVYGGASVGVMGTIADSMLEFGGEVTGVIPRSLKDKEIAHAGLTDLKVVDSMHARKTLMAELADGFIAMPGGLGTLEELFEVLTWAQLGFHQKPCGLLNTEHYYDLLAQFLDHAVAQGFVKVAHREMLLIEADPARLVDVMAAYKPVQVTKWL